MLLNLKPIYSIEFKYANIRPYLRPMLYSKVVKKHLKEYSLEQGSDPFLALIEKIAVKDERAMSELYDATVNRIYGLAIKIVLKPELAEEVVGDVFIQIWNKAKDFDSSRAIPLAWMLMICRSRSLDILQKEKKTAALELQEFDQKNIIDITESTPYQTIENLQLSRRITKALSILTEKQRITLCLAFYKDMSHQEISNHTGDPLGTVKTNLRRAQLILKETLCDEELTGGTTYE